jgi:hypothetical protein
VTHVEIAVKSLGNRGFQAGGMFERKGDVDDRGADAVEINSEDSFPASDAPSWTPIRRIGRPRLLTTEPDEVKSVH